MNTDFRISDEIKQLRRDIMQRYDVRVYLGGDHLVISPNQEVYSLGWNFKASTLEQTDRGIKAKSELWKFWNELGLSVFRKRSIKNPGNGNIQLSPTPDDDTTRVGLSYWDKNHRYWVVLEKQEDGTWIDIEVVDSLDRV